MLLRAVLLLKPFLFVILPLLSIFAVASPTCQVGLKHMIDMPAFLALVTTFHSSEAGHIPLNCGVFGISSEVDLQ